MDKMGIKKRLSLLYPAIFILISISIYLTFALNLIHKPLQADEIYFALDAEQLYYGKIGIGHPPLYSDSLRLMVRFLGLRRENLRFFGILCFMATLCLIYLIGKEMTPGDKKRRSVGLLASFIYATHPMAIQGSLILDIDNSILNLLLTLFVLFFLKMRDNLSKKKCFLLGLLFFACLWSKLSTPLVLIPCLFFFYCLQGQIREGLVKSFLVAAVGTGLFCIVWANYAYCHHLPPLFLLGRIAHPIQGGLGSIFSSFLPELVKRAIRISLWINPFLLFLGLGALAMRLKERSQKRLTQPIDFCLLYVLLIFFGYTLVFGTIWSFPKYHYPLLAVLALAAAEIIYKLNLKIDRKSLILYTGLTLFFILYNITVVGDLLYLFNYNLKNLLVLAPEKLPGVVKSFLLHFFFYLIPVFLAILAIKASHRNYRFLKTTILSLFIVLISANISLNILQARGDYSTTYCYGRDINNMRQLEDFFQELKSNNPQGIIIGPVDIFYNAGLKLPSYLYCIIGKSSKKFLEAIRDERVMCVVYGVSWNSLFSYQNVFSDKLVRENLSENYEYKEMGEYSVWLRKNLL